MTFVHFVVRRRRLRGSCSTVATKPQTQKAGAIAPALRVSLLLESLASKTDQAVAARGTDATTLAAISSFSRSASTDSNSSSSSASAFTA